MRQLPIGGMNIIMEVITSNQADSVTQLGLLESIMDLLAIDPIFLFGIVLIAVPLILICKKESSINKAKITFLSLIMYYYLCVMLGHIVGIPTLKEYIRLSYLGETFFNPKLNLIPLSDGFSLSFILNIFLFIPLGFLCPFISKSYTKMKNTILIGIGFSLFIEIAQLFTLHRATDINDLLTNVIGTCIGYLCSKWILTKREGSEAYSGIKPKGKDYTVYIPISIIAVTSILGFFS